MIPTQRRTDRQTFSAQSNLLSRVHTFTRRSLRVNTFMKYQQHLDRAGSTVQRSRSLHICRFMGLKCWFITPEFSVHTENYNHVEMWFFLFFVSHRTLKTCHFISDYSDSEQKVFSLSWPHNRIVVEFNKQGNCNTHLGSVGNITWFLGPKVDKVFTTTADALCFIHHIHRPNLAVYLSSITLHVCLLVEPIHHPSIHYKQQGPVLLKQVFLGYYNTLYNHRRASTETIIYLYRSAGWGADERSGAHCRGRSEAALPLLLIDAVTFGLRQLQEVLHGAQVDQQRLGRRLGIFLLTQDLRQ